MSDREAFVAAVAATPADDLPRLVFADWLDEHGDPDRAAFVRAQVYQQHDLADLLFHTHGEKWNAEFLPLLGIDPTDYVIRSNPSTWWKSLPDGSQRRNLGGSSITQNLHPRDDHEQLVGRFTYDRGFVERLDLPPLGDLGRCSFAAAFAREPITALSLHFGEVAESGVWARLSDPAFRRVRELTVEFGSRTSTPAVATLFHDLHLAGVRKLDLRGQSANALLPGRLPADALAQFGRSPLAYRLDHVELHSVGEGGLRGMCHNRQFHWRELSLSGAPGPNAPAHLANAGLTATLRRLNLTLTSDEGDPEFGDRGVEALAAGWWRVLTGLNLQYAGITEVGLRALSAASFIPQLEHLDLSHNAGMIDERGRLDAVRVMSEALDPSRLRSLDLTRTGLSHVPHFLAERFGERVTV